MKTTLNIPDATMRELKREAAKQGKTMSRLVEGALRAMLHRRKTHGPLTPLPTFRTGGARVNVANREALYEVMGISG